MFFQPFREYQTAKLRNNIFEGFSSKYQVLKTWYKNTSSPKDQISSKCTKLHFGNIKPLTCSELTAETCSKQIRSTKLSKINFKMIYQCKSPTAENFQITPQKKYCQVKPLTCTRPTAAYYIYLEVWSINNIVIKYIYKVKRKLLIKATLGHIYKWKFNIRHMVIEVDFLSKVTQKQGSLRSGI